MRARAHKFFFNLKRVKNIVNIKRIIYNIVNLYQEYERKNSNKFTFTHTQIIIYKINFSIRDSHKLKDGKNTNFNTFYNVL